MKKARMNISHSRFILFKLKIFGEIVTTYYILQMCTIAKFQRLLLRRRKDQATLPL